MTVDSQYEAQFAALMAQFRPCMYGHSSLHATLLSPWYLQRVLLFCAFSTRTHMVGTIGLGVGLFTSRGAGRGVAPDRALDCGVYPRRDLFNGTAWTHDGGGRHERQQPRCWRTCSTGAPCCRTVRTVRTHARTGTAAGARARTMPLNRVELSPGDPGMLAPPPCPCSAATIAAAASSGAPPARSGLHLAIFVACAPESVSQHHTLESAIPSVQSPHA